MQVGFIGLGKMGKNLVLNLLGKNHQVVAWNRSEPPRDESRTAGAQVSESIEALVQALPHPRVIWMMLPAGEATENMVAKLAGLLEAGDSIIDGSNSHYIDAKKRYERLRNKGIGFVDCGVSGGPEGALKGACLMIGGDRSDFSKLEPLFREVAAPGAYEFFPGAGAGHFVKMIHNGVEYGMMQALAEGFEVLGKSGFGLDLSRVAKVYNRQSVIASRLVDWLCSGYEQYGAKLAKISGSAGSGGGAGIEKSEAYWMVELAQEWGVPVAVIEASIKARVASQKKASYQGKVINLLRNQFGGHDLETK